MSKHHAMVHEDGQRTTLHTEQGDVDLTSDEYAVYSILARDRFATMTLMELAQRLGKQVASTDTTCIALHCKILEATGLDLVYPVAGGWRLERQQRDSGTTGRMSDGRSVVDHLRDMDMLRTEPDAVTTTNLEIAMRSLARAAAVCELEDDQSLAGAFYFSARSLMHELGGERSWDGIVQGARNYAEKVLTGKMNITNDR